MRATAGGRPRRTRGLRLAILVLLATTGCKDGFFFEPAPPEPVAVDIAMRMTVPGGSANQIAQEAFDRVDAARIVIRTRDGEVVFDEVVGLAHVSGGVVTDELEVDMGSTPEDPTVEAELRENGETVFTGQAQLLVGTDALVEVTIEVDLVEILLAPGDLCSEHPDHAVAAFADAGLAAAVRGTASLGADETLFCGLVEELPELVASNSGITSLVGAQNLMGLTVLDLEANAIGDIGPLGGLSGLESLDLASNSISDLTPLGGLTNLIELFLGSNSIADVGPLGALSHLDVLGLFGNPISDIQPLLDNPGLASGDEVDLRGTDVTCTDATLLEAKGVVVTSDAIPAFDDPNLETAVRSALGLGSSEPLTCDAVKGLTGLAAHDSGINGLGGIHNLTGLTSLSLNTSSQSPNPNTITDLGPLTDLTDLTFLSFRSNQISDLGPLSGLTELDFLDVHGNLVSDLGPIAGLTALTTLTLSVNSISDIGPLSDLTSLVGLSLAGNQISDLTPLSGLTSLTGLDLPNNQISDITPLAALTSLESLFLFTNQISDISALSGLTNLEVLDLAANGDIADINPLSGLTELTSLQLGANSIVDIGPLAALTALTFLDLGDNQIDDLSALSGLTALTALRLENNPIVDIQPLLDNTGLGAGDTVDLRSTEAPCPDVATLESRGVSVASDCFSSAAGRRLTERQSPGSGVARAPSPPRGSGGHGPGRSR